MSQNKQQMKTVERHLGVQRIDKKLRVSFLPDPTKQTTTLTLSDQSVKLETTQLNFPERDTFEEWIRVRGDEWIHIAKSRVGVYKPSHEWYKHFQRIALLIRGRYIYLQGVVYYFSNIQVQAWKVIWAYIAMTVTDVFSKYGLKDKIGLDKKILEYMDSAPDVILGSGNLKMLIADTKDPDRLARAQSLVASPVLPSQPQPHQPKQPQPQPKAPKAPTGPAIPTGPGKPAGPGKEQQQVRCPLCLSPDHQYSAGHYDHPWNMPITTKCAARHPQNRAEVCGEKHARNGSMASPCRWDLPGAAPVPGASQAGRQAPAGPAASQE
jgi:hypothetical protein